VKPLASLALVLPCLLCTVPHALARQSLVCCASVEIQSPSVGERWVSGSSQVIAWTASNASQAGELQLFYWDGSSWLHITTVPVTARSYTWRVPRPSVSNAALFVGWSVNGSWVGYDTQTFTIDPGPPPGDFDGDGRSDLLWHHATRGEVWIWAMDETTRRSGMQVTTVPDTGYRVVGTGDFDGDGMADLLWHHATRGEVWVWLMNGATPLSQAKVGTVADTGYQIVGAADYTGDGKADILWHHATRGEVWVWAMDGTTRLSGTWVTTVPDTEYRIVGTGDYNGDEKADLLWHHVTRGEVWVWLMNGAAALSQTQVGTVPDTGYQIVYAK